MPMVNNNSIIGVISMTTSNTIKQDRDTVSQQEQNINKFAELWNHLSEAGKKVILDQYYNNYKPRDLSLGAGSDTEEFIKFMFSIMDKTDQIAGITSQETTQDPAQDPDYTTNPDTNLELSLLSQSLSDSMKHQFTYSADMRAMIKEVANHIYTKRAQAISQQASKDGIKMQDKLMAGDKLIYEKLVNLIQLADKERRERERKQRLASEPIVISEKEAELALKLIQEYKAKEVIGKLLNISPDKCKEVASHLFKNLMTEFKHEPNKAFSKCVHFVRELEQLKHPSMKYSSKKFLIEAGDTFKKEFKQMIDRDNEMRLAFDLFNKVGFLTKPNGITRACVESFNRGLAELKAGGKHDQAVAMVEEIVSYASDDTKKLLSMYSPKPKSGSALSEEERLKEKEEQERPRPTPFDLFRAS